jgi:Tol biopolymer transport system component
VKKPDFLETVRRQRAARNEIWSRGPLPEPVDLTQVDDFDLGTWRVQIAESRIVRDPRVLELDETVLRAVVLIARAGSQGIPRDTLCLHLFGPVRPENHPAKLRRVTSFLRRALGDDGSVRLVNTIGDGYAFETGPAEEGRLQIDEYDHDAPMRIDPPHVAAYLKRKRRRGLALSLAAGVVVALALVLVFLVERREGVLYGHIVKTTVWAHAPGAQLSPSFAPNGQRVVYSWRKPDGTQKLYIRALNAEQPVALTEGSGRDEYPVWSPKGNFIAFTRRGSEGCAVMVVAPEGGEPRRLTDCDFRAAGQLGWVRDGSAVLTAHRSAWDAPSQVLAVTIADGKSSVVTNPTVGMPGDSNPALATNSRRLAFVRTRAVGAEDLQVLDFDSGKPIRMTYDLAPIAGAAWEQGGHSIILASARRGPSSLWRIRMDGLPPERLVSSADPLQHPSMTDDGRALAYEHWHVTSGFRTYGAASADEGRTYRRGIALERSLTLSADGTVTAYISNLGDQDRVYLAAAPDGVPRPISQGRYDSIESVRLSPDGRRLAFTGVVKGHLDVYLIDLAAGSPEVRLAGDGESRAPSFSHDSKAIYFASTRNEKHWQIFRQSVDQNTAVQLTNEGGMAAEESADGQWLYFVRADRKGLWQRSSAPGGDDLFLVGDLSPLDWQNLAVGRDAVWFVTRPAGDPVLARYVFAKGRVEAGALVPGLLNDSGLTLLPSGQQVVVAELIEAQVDIDIATLQ